MSEIGIDIVEIERIKKLHDKFGDKFPEKILNEKEIEYLKSKNMSAQTLASMFSIKEAVAKAYGVGFGSGIGFKDIEIFYDEFGKPYAILKNLRFNLSTTHDAGVAVSVATLEKAQIEIPKSVLELYIPRKENGHKGSFGKAMIIAGSKGMTGSGYLAATAALKTGAGLVYHYVRSEDEIFLPLSIKHTEVILKDSDPLMDLKKIDAVLFGPGAGINRYNRGLLSNLLYEDINLVIDADGISMLAEDTNKLKFKKAKIILTPHLVEFSRLIGKVIPPGEELYEAARAFAREFHIILVLKDSKTIVTDGFEIKICDRENSGLATAGSGDVLAGIITSLYAQKYKSFDAAYLGVQIHSLAGEVAAIKNSKTSMVASDIIDGLKEVFRKLEKNN